MDTARENEADSPSAHEVSAVSVSTSIVLVCATLCSLAMGVLIAYGICLVMFRLFSARSRQVIEEKRVALVVGGVQS